MTENRHYARIIDRSASGALVWEVQVTVRDFHRVDRLQTYTVSTDDEGNVAKIFNGQMKYVPEAAARNLRPRIGELIVKAIADGALGEA